MSIQNLILLVFSGTNLAEDLVGLNLLSPYVQICLANNLVTLRTYSPNQDFSTFISLSPFHGAFLDFFSLQLTSYEMLKPQIYCVSIYISNVYLCFIYKMNIIFYFFIRNFNPLGMIWSHFNIVLHCR